MQKIFYVSRNSEDGSEDLSGHAPDMDRFQRIDKLNEMISLGWKIVGMNNDGKSTYFVLEK